MQNASLVKRFMAFFYEAFSLTAVWLLCTFIFILLFGDIETPSKRLSLQALLWALTGGYFVLCWVKTGQTLAMQAWKIKLVNVENNCLSFRYALLRYGLATISLSVFGVGFLWALFDKERLFLHDRLLRSRIAQLTKG